MSRQYYEYEGNLWRCSLDDIFDYCRDRKVYLYGAGVYGRFLKDQLAKAGIEIEGFLVTDRNDETSVDGVSVYTLEEINYHSASCRIVITSGNYAKEIEKILIEKGITEYRTLQINYIKPNLELRPKSREDERCLSDMQDGLLRIRITNRCPGRCDFCGQLAWSEEEQQMEMNPDWYFKYLRPLYSQLKMILITGGDSFFASKSFEFMQFLSENYPQITIMTESNGLAFSEKFQKLACDNLFMTHFSLNASNEETYVKGCWSSPGGDKAYKRCLNNVKSYLELLKSEGKLCFAPNVSMVINSNTANDVIDFVKLALKLKMSYSIFYFDYRENDMSKDYFEYPEIGRKALRELMEIERVLKDKFNIAYRLWTPLKEVEMMELQLEKTTDEELAEKYSDLLELAHGRSVIEEHEERNRIRKLYGKKELSYEEDFSSTVQKDDIHGTKVCRAGWKELDIYPNGRIDFCGWHEPTLLLTDYIEGDAVNWTKVINSEEYCTYRSMMLEGDYTGCMDCCPIVKELAGKN